MSQTVLLVFTNHSELGTTGKKTGYYLPEAAHPYHVFKNAGYSIDFASPKGGKSPLDQSSVEAFKDDKASTEFLNDKEVQDKVNNTLRLSDVDPSKYSVVLFVGGHGPMFDLSDDQSSHDVVRKIYEANDTNIVAAVCHGPVGIANVKLSNGSYLVSGKKVTAFSNAEEDAVELSSQMPFMLETKLKENGALYEKAAENWGAHVVGDQRVFTGQNPASASPLAEAIVSQLKK
ncbi:hypothetical protein AKO1_006673 [Acrasis kona]|uniref:DJ-1/PfpI domain-containing protein n=1 Tax=Acrasis kona TaxID=1008807 RepID=A0AAW2ZK28_9EUKA